MKGNKLHFRDITFLAILSAVLLLLSGAIMPFVMTTQFFALRQLVGSIFFAPMTVIALSRVPKWGALTVVGFCTGIVLLFMSPVMFVNNVLGAVLTESVVWILFRTYKGMRPKRWAAVLYMPMTLPITFLYNHWVLNRSLLQQFGGNIGLCVCFILGVFVIAFVGAKFGERIVQELRRAGKLPEEAHS